MLLSSLPVGLSGRAPSLYARHKVHAVGHTRAAIGAGTGKSAPVGPTTRGTSKGEGLGTTAVVSQGLISRTRAPTRVVRLSTCRRAARVAHNGYGSPVAGVGRPPTRYKVGAGRRGIGAPTESRESWSGAKVTTSFFLLPLSPPPATNPAAGRPSAHIGITLTTSQPAQPVRMFG